jgi:hypothetical protein
MAQELTLAKEQAKHYMDIAAPMILYGDPIADMIRRQHRNKTGRRRRAKKGG